MREERDRSQILSGLLALVRSLHFALRTMAKHRDFHGLMRFGLCSKITLATEGILWYGLGRSGRPVRRLLCTPLRSDGGLGDSRGRGAESGRQK